MMAKTQTTLVTGDKEIDAAMLRLENKLRKVTIKKALREAVKVHVLPHAKENVPFLSGALESSLKVRAAKFRGREGRHSIGLAVQQTDFDTYYAKFLEFGTEFMGPDPFLRPAIYDTKESVRATFAARLKSLLPADIRSAAGGS